MVIAGSIDSDGTILAGKGFTVEHDVGSPGVYIVRTQPRYPRLLSAVANAGNSGQGLTVRAGLASDSDGPYVKFVVFDDTGTQDDDVFNFVIVAQNTSLRG